MNTTYIVNGEIDTGFDERHLAINYAQNELGLKVFRLLSDKDREFEITILDNKRYRLSSTLRSSSRYGNCEVCDQHVSEVFIQVLETKRGSEYYSECSMFGHEECLKNIRKT